MAHTQLIERGRPINEASKALILIHGRGATALDMLSLTRRLDVDSLYIAAPQAPHNSWYPQRFTMEEKFNEPWLSQSIETIQHLIEKTAAFIPTDSIYLAGFSQGACLALETSTRAATKYGGIIALSGGLIGHEIDESKYHGNFEETRVFIGVSDQDPHIPLVRCKQSKQLMEKMGAHVTLRVYEGMSHTINEDEINWIKQLLVT